MAAVAQNMPDDDQDDGQELEAGMILVTLGKASFKDVVPGGARAFHDRDDRHPDGEIWVRAGKMGPDGKQIEPYVVRCYRTASVAQAIADGRLRELPATAKPSAKPVSIADMVDQVNLPTPPATALVAGAPVPVEPAAAAEAAPAADAPKGTKAK